MKWNSRQCLRLVVSYLVFILSIGNLDGQDAIYSSHSIHHPVYAKNGMVATQHPEATQVGLDILKAGGNAVDAAVAVGFALAVVLPRAGNLGGGGFMLHYNKDLDSTFAFDYRERAPGRSERNMFLDDAGNVDNDKFNQSYLSIGVPGTVAGLCRALEKQGSMTLPDVLAPAIRLAEEGFTITLDFATLLKKYEDRLKQSQTTKKVFFPKTGGYYKAGDVLVQKDLAWTLRQISNSGPSAFYSGKIAKKLARCMKKFGGLVDLKDLATYQTKEVHPVSGTYRGHRIVSMPPPSSGGVHIIQMLNILEGFDLGKLGYNSAAALHLMAEAMRLAYADRSKHLGDPDFWNVPIDGIISKSYAESLRERINPDSANRSVDILPGNPDDFESEETTHFSVVDQYGNVVSNTYTLNFSFGSGLMAEGTGFLLNNEMGDFSAKPGTMNAYGLIGDEANAVQPGKTPLSSMTPTIVFKEDKPYVITGSPGGSRIITTVMQIIINVIDHKLNISEATHGPRIHHQWYPDILYFENVLSIDTRNILKGKGHILEERDAMGSTQSILIENGLYQGCSDPRRPDAKTLGY